LYLKNKSRMITKKSQKTTKGWDTSPPHCCNCGNDHTATFMECPARPSPTSPTRSASTVPPGQDPMDMAVDGGPAPSTPPARVGPTEVDLVTPSQPPPAGPPRPGTIQGFGGPLPLGVESPSPTPSDRRARPGNDYSPLPRWDRAGPKSPTTFHCST